MREKKNWLKTFIEDVLFRQSTRMARRVERLQTRSNRSHKRIMDNLNNAAEAFRAGDLEAYDACAKRAAYLEARHQKRVQEPLNDLMRQVGLSGSIIDPPNLDMRWFSQPLPAILRKDQNAKQ